MMDLLGEFLLFGLGPAEGPLLFGASSIQQSPASFGGATRASRPYRPTNRYGDILTFDEQAADDDEVATALIAILCQVHP
jgi:hypothetical protein